MRTPGYAILLCICLYVCMYPMVSSARVWLNGSQLLYSSSSDVSSSSLAVGEAEMRPYFIKGVNYSPQPIGTHPAWTWPYGDFFLSGYRDIWQRDLPLLRSLGSNTLRIRGWNNELDHTDFLNALVAHDLRALIVYPFGSVSLTPIGQPWQQQQFFDALRAQVTRYMGHPAILGWIIGENMNNPDVGLLAALNGIHNCGWNGNDHGTDAGGCVGMGADDAACASARKCVYMAMLGFLNEAAKHAKPGDHTHIVVAPFTDFDDSVHRLSQYADAAPDIDAFGLSANRGRDFGQGSDDVLTNYETAPSPLPHRKPLILMEYGVDAYRDPCGASSGSPCYNGPVAKATDTEGEDELTHADWNVHLSELLLQHSSAGLQGDVAGGFYLSWLDESWRCTQNVGGCWGPVPFNVPGFDPSLCAWKVRHTHLCARTTCSSVSHECVPRQSFPSDVCSACMCTYVLCLMPCLVCIMPECRHMWAVRSSICGSRPCVAITRRSPSIAM